MHKMYNMHIQYAQYAICMFDNMHNMQDNMQINTYPICQNNMQNMLNTMHAILYAKYAQ